MIVGLQTDSCIDATIKDGFAHQTHQILCRAGDDLLIHRCAVTSI